MRNLISISMILSLGLSSCSKPIPRPDVRKSIKVNSSDLDILKNRELPRTPTNPEGGLIKGKSKAVATEEDIRRQTKNRQEAIVWNKSFAGITMKTDRTASKEILSTPYFSNGRADFFAEDVVILWGQGINPTPSYVRVEGSYSGAIALPAPYGEVSLGQDIPEFDGQKPVDLEKFAIILGQAFADKDANYNCLATYECLIDIREEFTWIDFPTGTIQIKANTIAQIEFTTNILTAPTSKAPIVPGVSLAGISMDMGFEQVKAILGSHYDRSEGNDLEYEGRSIRVSFLSAERIRSVLVADGYQGKLKLGNEEFGIGSSLAAFGQAIDDAEGLLIGKKLGKMILGKEADNNYDCTAVMPAPECSITISENKLFIVLVIGNTTLFVSNDETRTLLAVTLTNTAG